MKENRTRTRSSNQGIGGSESESESDPRSRGNKLGTRVGVGQDASTAALERLVVFVTSLNRTYVGVLACTSLKPVLLISCLCSDSSIGLIYVIPNLVAACRQRRLSASLFAFGISVDLG